MLTSKLLRLCCFVFCLLSLTAVQGQELVRFTPPDSISVCEPGVYEFVFEDLIAPRVIVLELPDGLIYEVGGTRVGRYIGGAPHNPFFTPDDDGGGRWRLVVELIPDCEAYERINAGELLEIDVLLNSGEYLTTLPALDVLTPFLVLDALPRLLLKPNDPTSFRLTAQNTRRGFLTEAVIEVVFPANLEVAPLNPRWQNLGMGRWLLEIGEEEIRATGNRNSRWELGERLNFDFTLTHSACQAALTDYPIEATVSWGCQDAVCQEDLEAGVISLDRQTGQPRLTMKIDTIFEPCFCDEVPSKVCVTIINESTVAAMDLQYTWWNIADYNSRLHADTNLRFQPPQDSAGTRIVIPIGTKRNDNGLPEIFLLQVPYLGGNDSIEFCMDLYNSPLSVNFRDARFNQLLTYRNTCEPFEVLQTFSDTMHSKLYGFQVLVEFLTGPPFVGGDTIPARLRVDMFNNTGGTGAVDLFLHMPCGVRLVDSSFLLRENPPLFKQRMGDVWQLRYQDDEMGELAFIDFEFVVDCQDMLQCFDTEGRCIQRWVGPVPSCVDGLSDPLMIFCTVGKFSPCEEVDLDRICGFGEDEFASFGVPFECEEFPTCIDTSDLYWTGETTARRTTIGLADNDDDRIADGTAKANHPGIRDDRLIAGDTFEVVFKGALHADDQSGTVDSIEWHVYMTLGGDIPNGEDPGNENALPLLRAIEWLDTEIEFTNRMNGMKIRRPVPRIDINQDDRPKCGDVQVFFTSQSIQHRTFVIGPKWLRNNGLANYSWARGDSITLRARYRQHFNPVPPEQAINFSANDYIFTGKNSSLQRYARECRDSPLQLRRTTLSVTAETQLQDGCTFSSSKRMIQWRLNAGMNNAFPFEYRNIYLPKYLSLPRIFGITVEDAQWDIYHEDDQFIQTLFRSFPATYTETADEIQFEFPEANELWWDENAILALQLDYKMEPCLPFQPGSSSAAWNACVRITEGHPLRRSHDDSLFVDSMDWFVPINARPRRPRIDWNVPNTLVTPPADSAIWEITFNYSQVEEGMEMAFQLSNQRFEWGQLCDENGQIGTAISKQDYRWTPGQVSGEVRGMVKTRQRACTDDNVWLRYGWRCADQEEICYTDSIQLFSQPQGVEFEMQVTGPDQEVELCEPFTHHEVWLFNADRGDAFAPVIEAQLPPGLEYLAGSSEVRIGGSATWQAVGDPTGIVDLIRWETAAWLPGGVLGSVDKAPDHQLRLRFLTRPVCGFVSGDRVTFTGTGQNACFERANSIFRSGPSLDVTSDQPLPSAVITWLGTDTVYACTESVQLAWQIDFSEPTTASDSFWVYLPTGTMVDTTGSRWSNGAAATWNFHNPGNRLRLAAAIPPGVRSVTVSLHALIPPTIACGPLPIEAQTLQSGMAQCGSDPTPCAVFRLTGRLNFSVFVKKAQLTNASGSWYIAPDGRRFVEFRVAKQPGSPGTEMSWTLFTDQPPIGVLDSSDRAVYSFGVAGSAWTGDRLEWEESIPDSIAALACNWWLVLKAEDNCLCEDLRIPLESNRPVIHAVDTLCPRELWHIGVDSMEGYSYQWRDIEIDCDTCARISIQAVDLGQIRTARLDVTTPQSCRQSYIFSLFRYPGPPALPADTVKCGGQVLGFQVSPGYSWTWHGPGISDPGAGIQRIVTDSNALYRIDWMSAEGCSFTDSMRVRVYPDPLVALDSLYIFCPGEERIVDGVVEGAIRQYTWIPGNQFEDENAFPGRLRSAARSGKIELLVVDSAGCSARDTAEVIISPLNLELNVESVLLCEGDSIRLEASGGERYRWVPGQHVLCDTCRSTIWFPSTDGSIRVYAEDDFGCTDSLDVHASYAPGFMDSLVVFKCPEEGADLGDTTVFEAGRYTRRYAANTFCDSTIVYDVMDYLVDPPVIVGDSLVLLGDTVRWTAQGGGPGTYRWQGPFDYLSCDTCKEIRFTLSDSGEVVLTWISEQGCELELRRRIRYFELQCPEADNVFVPSAFSPNGDGVNDVLMVRGAGDAEIYFLVYNRWGEEVFRSTHTNIGWDGRFNNVELAPDTYSYYLELTCPGGEIIQKKGNVTLFD
jgi:gliding motility-associated-like protein